MAESISIDDLAAPVLTEAQIQALRYTETIRTDFDPAGILEEASRDTGLEDFGPTDFRRRLDLLCDEWGNDPELTGLGRVSLRAKLATFARSRLLIRDLLRRHPEIHDKTIEAPIIVCGLPRSGTTHLLNLLASDTRLRSLPLWESYEPVLAPGETVREGGPDPRYERCQKQWEMAQMVTPLLMAMHPMNPDHIHEELELMGPDFASYNFEWLAVSPRWRDDYYAHDQTPHYRYMQTVLKLLQWQDRRAGRHRARGVLKCPQHLEQLPVSMKVFPDATILLTHRDPVAVIQSAITMLAYGQRISRTRVGTRELLTYWSDRIESLLQACVRDRGVAAASSSLDIPFDRFMADDLGTLRRIYDTARLELTAEASAAHRAFLHEHPRGRHGQVVYRLERDFGIRTGELRERFGFYFEAFPVAAEGE